MAIIIHNILKAISKYKIVSIFLATSFSVIWINSTDAQPLKLIDLSGRIINIGEEALSGVLIKVTGKDRGVVTNKNGMYNILTEVGDTVIYYKPGYNKRQVIVSDTLTDFSYSLDLTLTPDTIFIDPVIIFPWKTYEEFKQAFLALKKTEDRDIENAVKNIALVRTQVILYDAPNPEKNFKYVMQQQINDATYYGMAPSYSILNPFAWVSFFKSLEDGSLINSRDLPSVSKSDKP